MVDPRIKTRADVTGKKGSRRGAGITGGSPVESAGAADLVYVTDSRAGIERIKQGKGFAYFYQQQEITGREQIARIKALAIPPAWERVWICPLSNGHLQATGYDTRARKQYRYHPRWRAMRSRTKFYRLYSFGRAIPAIRKNVQKDLGRGGLPREKVLAVVIRLMEETNIRIGSEHYEKRYGSFGLSTFKDRHVKVKGPGIRFRFIGKKGIRQPGRLQKILRASAGAGML